MVITENKNQFVKLVKEKLSEKEQNWLTLKIEVLSNLETEKKFPVFFSLTSRFISNDVPEWSGDELKEIEGVYPGFSKAIWTKQDLARVILMFTLSVETNKKILEDFFEIAEMHELIALYRGLYFLENAAEFNKSVEEGIRTNMVNVYDAIIEGNPFAKTYLEEWAWNQLVLKALFLERSLYTIQFIDEGKNDKLAEMLQDYVKERWAANRDISPEIWRMIYGRLRDDLRKIILEREFSGVEKDAIDCVLLEDDSKNTSEFWNTIGKNK